MESWTHNYTFVTYVTWIGFGEGFGFSEATTNMICFGSLLGAYYLLL